MLGMMNCPTDGVDVYAASPSSKRLLYGNAPVTSVDKKSEDNSADSTSASTSINSQEGVLAEDQQQKNKSLRVFAEAKKKTGISYTPDGRKLVDGKLTEKGTVAPDKMWNKLLVNSMIGKIAPRRGTCKKTTKSGKNKSQQQAMPVIEPAAAVPIQVSNK